MSIELLAPAGNFEKLQTALIYGADAVYIGGKNFNLRAYSENFDESEIIQAVNFTHKLGKKIYVTVNIFAKNDDFDELAAYLKFLDDVGVDAVLISDLGVFTLAKEVTKNLGIHVSTQANVTNYRAVKFFNELGADRIVLARELTLDEIVEIKRNYFVFWALLLVTLLDGAQWQSRRMYAFLPLEIFTCRRKKTE